MTLLGGASCLPGMDAYGRCACAGVGAALYVARPLLLLHTFRAPQRRCHSSPHVLFVCLFRSTPSKLDGESDGTEQPEEAQSRAPLAPLDANAAAARRAANPQAAALSLLDDFAEEASSRRIHAAVAQAKERALGGRAAAARGAHAAAQGASQVAGRVSVLWAPRARPAAAPEAELVGVNVESGVAAADGAAPQPQAAAAGAEQLAREQQAALNRQWQLERNLRKSAPPFYRDWNPSLLFLRPARHWPRFS